jgi:diacylglycerol O-acyltransferase / wax synthase
MPRYAYDRLTALDNSFLILERPNAYMHVASTLIFEAGPLRQPDGGVDAEAVKRLTLSALHRIPRYRQKLAWAPVLGHPYWVDDPNFNIDYHIRHTSLPRPGTEEQLKRLSGRIMQQHLDRQRPLWEMWVVEGLEGDRFAVISKVHHCMIDGISGVDILRELLSMTPEHDVHEPAPFIPRPMPSGPELLRAELTRWATLPLTTFGSVRALIREATETRREAATRLRAVATAVGTSFRTGSETPLNGEIGPHRRFDWLPMDINEIKAVRRALGGSLNDVVLTVVTGAVRRFLLRRHVNPATIEFRIMAPVSVRTEDERGTLGNRVSAWLLPLPVSIADPRKQLEIIAMRTDELKRSRQAVGASVLTQMAEWTPSTLLALAGRNVTRLLPFNMVVTNVPGPQMPMYMLGSRMLESYPHVPLVDGLGLGIALLSCEGKLCWGFNADYDLIPDLRAFVDAIREAFRELRQLANASAPQVGATISAPAGMAAAPKGNGQAAQLVR